MRKAALSVLMLLSFAACSSSGYKTQEYAKLSNVRDFEYEFANVWEGTVSALAEYKIEKKVQEDGRIETDWVYSTSNDKYVEYEVNGFPRKKFLQTRYRYLIQIDKKYGKVTVTVNLDEEVEKLTSEGSFASWTRASAPDSARAADMLKLIDQKIMSLPPR